MFDPRLLDSFLTIVEEGSFVAAARRLGTVPSTVSQHIRRLESDVGRRLLDRDTHAVALSVDGEAFVEFARRIVDANMQARAYFADSEMRGRVRFGVSEDFALSPLLPLTLRRFSHRYPSIDIELTVGLSADLHAKVGTGELDLIFAKRRPGEDRGVLVWQDPLTWIGAPDRHDDPAAPIPLILYPVPSITRTLVLKALTDHGRRWRIACTCTSLGGLRSAVSAGLGVTAQSRRLIPDGLVPIAARANLPTLPFVDFILLPAQKAPPRPVTTLMNTIMEMP